MLAALDVHYRDPGAVAAGVLFRDWADAAAVRELTASVASVERYQPGAFYLRELPCLLAVLEKVREPLSAIVIDGYVWLGDLAHPGLGAHLHEALGRRVPVIGVAKSAFHDLRAAVPVVRGRSRRPLYVTAAGIDPMQAAELIRAMHGAHRIPTLLARVDRLARQAAL